MVPLRPPFLVVFVVLTLTSLAAPITLAQPAGKAGGNTKAADAFDRLRALAGRWAFTADSDRGTVTYEVVSNGTAILERVMNEEHGTAGMVSMIYLEEDRLVLQHYCSAGNQPRLVSTGLDGHEIRFTFERATNLPSIGIGHIHAAVFTFPGTGPFTSRWTWLADGVETTSTRRHERAK